MNALFDIVVPASRRHSLQRLLEALGRTQEPDPGRIVVVDDRPGEPGSQLVPHLPPALEGLVQVVRGRAAGPAAARNTGWRCCTAEWVTFLDDDVVPSKEWAGDLAADLSYLPPEVAASQAWIEVPLARDRRPTDWERNVAALEQALYATADIAYRRTALEEVGGFDERFPHAYREDADLALRVMHAGYRLERGRRRSVHSVGPTSLLTSVKLQSGNADDALMTALHGPGWRVRAGVRPGCRSRHVVTTASGIVGLGALALRRRRIAAAGGAGWLALTLRFAWDRIAPGPRSAPEIAAMLITSALIPASATSHWFLGWARLPLVLQVGRPRPTPRPHVDVAPPHGTCAAPPPACPSARETRPAVSR